MPDVGVRVRRGRRSRPQRSEPAAETAAWLTFCGLLVLFTLATTWLAKFFGLLAKTVEGAGAFSCILLLLIFISPRSSRRTP